MRIMDWLKISLIGVLSLVSFLVMLENADLRKSVEDLKSENLKIITIQEKTFEKLNHTLNFLETTEHAKENYRVKMEEYAGKLAENKAELQRCDENKAEFIWIAEDVANANEWEANVYDCSEFSRDLVYELKKNGYRARVVHGYNYYIDGKTCGGVDLKEFNCRHDWVCLGERYDYGVCIEAVRGGLIPHSLYDTYYEFEGEGKW